MASDIAIEVAYARADVQTVIPQLVQAGTTVRQAIEISGLLGQFKEIDLSNAVVGIFGKKVALEKTLVSGDRVEIYRPLQIDPKQARKYRAELAKAGK